MVEPTPEWLVQHYKAVADHANAKVGQMSELWRTYYRQCRAQEKGIKRLHRKIARLKTMLASAKDKLQSVPTANPR